MTGSAQAKNKTKDTLLTSMFSVRACTCLTEDKDDFDEKLQKQEIWFQEISFRNISRAYEEIFSVSVDSMKCQHRRYAGGNSTVGCEINSFFFEILD